MLGFPVTTRMTWNVFGRPGIPILTFILTESKKQGGKDVRHIVCAKPIQFWFKMSSSTWIFHLSGDIFWNKVMKHDIAPGYYPNPSNDFVYSGGSLASRFLKRRNGSYHPQLQSFPAPIRGLTGHLHLLAILTWTKLEAQSRSRWILVIFHYWSSSHMSSYLFVNLRWSYKCWPHAMDYRIFSRLQHVQNARIFPQNLDKTLAAISRHMAKGKKTNQSYMICIKLKDVPK